MSPIGPSRPIFQIRTSRQLFGLKPKCVFRTGRSFVGAVMIRRVAPNSEREGQMVTVSPWSRMEKSNAA